MGAFLLEPWSYGFMQRALFEVLLIALACGPIGALLTLRRLAYAGESLGHALVPGVAVALAVGLAGGWGALVGALVAAVAVALLIRRSGAYEDVAIALVFAVGLAGGVVLLVLTAPPQRATAVLFGDLLAADRLDLAGAVLVAAVLTGLVIGGGRWATLAIFDPAWARTIGLRTGAVDVVLLVAAAFALVVALRGLGALLGLALLLGPAAILRPWVRRVGPLLLLTAPVGALAGLAGLLLSYHAGLATGPAIATILLVGFLSTRAAAVVWEAARPFPYRSGNSP
jgi:ABC-type Mn2+/Zn2+ transport system permease subunit